MATSTPTPLPEDIFETTEPTLVVAPAAPSANDMSPTGARTPSIPALPGELFENSSLSGGKKFLLALIGVVIIGLMVVGGVILFRQIRSGGAPSVIDTSVPPPEVPAVIPPPPDGNAPDTSNSTDQVFPSPIAVPLPPAVIDTDLDGLTDDEEITLGTDPRNADTDGDGLFDREEVRTWKTNPKNPDTDGDTYLDGSEVENGYNPNGPGKLQDFDRARNELEGRNP